MLPASSPRTQASAAERLRAAWRLGGMISAVCPVPGLGDLAGATGRGTLVGQSPAFALPLAGLWRYRLYTYRWVSLFVWLYAAEGLVRMVPSPASAAGWPGEAGLSVLILSAARWCASA